ncbi:hypothetical protein FLAVO9R_110084 [Flavobacterium sp. 9R]|nr:hypothetical protein FLAVO9R_110084 [Flavobacterium sp. 9R]
MGNFWFGFISVVGKNKKPEYCYSGFVVPPGIEPGTHGFSVHCSTI